MPDVRFTPVRRVSLRRLPNDIQKLTMIRALYIMVFNAEDSLIPLAVELFHLVGSILEGVPSENLPFSRVSKTTFLETYDDLLQRDNNEGPHDQKETTIDGQNRRNENNENKEISTQTEVSAEENCAG